MFLKSQFALLNPGGAYFPKKADGFVDPFYNRVINFESMDEGWRLVCKDMGWEHRMLEKVNVSGGPKWQSFYSEKQLESLKPLIMPDLRVWNSLK